MMAEPPNNSIADLERLRSALESNIEKLRQALQHWETWEFEYESLKEELQHMKGGSSTDVMLELGKTFGSDLINEKELRELFGLDQGSRRTVAQVVDVISKRQEYVQKNVETIKKQLEGSQGKLKSVLGVKENLEDETGLPLMEIVEELDEDDNVISGKLSAPSASASQIMEAFQKAGVAEALEPDSAPTKEAEEPKPAPKSEPISTAKAVEAASASDSPKLEAAANEALDSSKGKKKVSFSAEVEEKTIPSRPEVDERRSGFDPSIAKGFFTTDKNNTKLIQLDEYDQSMGSMPIIPHNESPEDAALRREMLAYSLNEVGAVVAEIDLEEDNGEGWSDDEDMVYNDDSDNYDDSEESEVENEYGMDMRRHITPEYAEKMAALEAKLNARMIENLGPQPDEDAFKELMSEDARVLVVNKDSEHDKIIDKNTEKEIERPAEQLAEKPKDKKKGVRFADDLDVSPAPASVSTPKQSEPVASRSQPVVSEAIIERSSSTQPTEVAPPKPKKVSKFKAARAAAQSHESPSEASSVPSEPSFRTLPEAPVHRPTPTGPKGKLVAPQVIERDTPSRVAPPDDSGLDPELLQREATNEFYKRRNQMIQKQGGFAPTEEEEENPLYEERDGKLRKVSRFKAARLKAQGL